MLYAASLDKAPKRFSVSDNIFGGRLLLYFKHNGDTGGVEGKCPNEIVVHHTVFGGNDFYTSIFHKDSQLFCKYRDNNRCKIYRSQKDSIFQGHYGRDRYGKNSECGKSGGGGAPEHSGVWEYKNIFERVRGGKNFLLYSKREIPLQMHREAERSQVEGTGT